MASGSLRKLHPQPLARAQWAGGLLAERFAACRDGTVPALGRIMLETERVRFAGNFEVAAGLTEGRHRGPKWNDGDFYKWMEAASAMLAFAPDKQLDAQLDDCIALIAKAQAPDGYIHTDVQIAQRAGHDVPRFGNPLDFEMYNMGHLISAACVHNRATGKDNFLEIARKTADFLAREFAHPTPERARNGICPSHLMALIDLFHLTGEARYRDLAKRLLDMRDLVTHGDDDNQDRIPLRQQRQAVGHAVRATYLYAGATDIYAEANHHSLLEPLDAIWKDLTTRKLYITGGCGALFDGASPDGAEDQKSIARVHQAFGRDYQLPNSTAHNETCAAVGSFLWNWRMLQISAEARYADLMEQTLYNSILGGVSLDGTRFFYTNTLRQLDPMPVPLRWPRHRQPSLSCMCCPPNVARTLVESPTYAYAVADRGLHVVLYGASELDTSIGGQPLKLSQQTDYPWDGHIRLTIEAAPPDEFSIFLRIPAWAAGATITTGHSSPVPDLHPDPPPEYRGRELCGKATKPAAARKIASISPSSGTPGEGWGGSSRFHEIRRTWHSGDTIDLDLPMPVRLIESNPMVEETRNHLAVMRGPIVYCLESADLPKGIRLLDVHLPADPALKPVRMSDLAGVVALEGKGLAIAAGDWSHSLYRDHAQAEPKEFHLLLVPYFAWDNRAEGEMSVWLPTLQS